MPEHLLIYILLFVVVVAINIIPAFMPATWIILSFFFIHYDLHLIPTVVLGAIAASFGRIGLTYIARLYLAPVLPKQMKINLKALGKLLTKNKHMTIPLILFYAFLPIPSNQVFIAAGLADIDITLIIISFFLGRIISYTFWVSVADHFVGDLQDIFIHHFDNPHSLLIEIAGIALLFVISIIPWKRFL